MGISKRTLFVLACLFVLAGTLYGQENYRTLGEIESALKEAETNNPNLVKLFSIGKSYNGKDILVVRIAAEGQVEPDQRQAMFLAANIEGYRYLASETCLRAVDYLLKNRNDEKIAKLLATRTFYLAPLLNPDVYSSLAKGPAFEYRGNGRKINDDLDLMVNEDGPDDLNGDGVISYMRYKDPEGEMIVDPDDERQMLKVDASKGIRGQYKVIFEGIDNDKDGRINEDGPDGVIIDRNFPHDYRHYEKGAGQWSASEPETVALINFMLQRKNIGLVYLFGSENTLLNPGEIKGEKQGQKTMRVPPRFAGFLGLDPSQQYPVEELISILKEQGFGDGEVTADSLAILFGAGPAMKISSSDMDYFSRLSKEFKEFLTAKKLDNPERKAKPMSGNGSFSSWVYFQHGIPSITADIWAFPEEGEKDKKKEDDPEKATNLRRGRIIDWAEANLKGSGYTPWTKYQHPTLGEVEIGGMKPLLEVKPPLKDLAVLIEANIEFAVSQAAKLAEVEISHFAAEKLSDGVYEVTAIIGNTGFFPTALSQGVVNKKIYPVIVKLGVEREAIFHGSQRVSISSIKGFSRSDKIRWVISGKTGDKISLEVKTLKSGNVKTELTLQ